MRSSFLSGLRGSKGRFACRFALASLLGLIASLFVAQVAQAQAKKPNILVIFGDDVGQTDISAYSLGVMGFTRRTSTALRRKG